MPASSLPGMPPSGNVAALISAAAERFGDRPALLAGGAGYSWEQWDRAADNGAAALAASGVLAGDRVVLALPTSVELAVAVVSVWRAGAVAAPIDPARADPQAAAQRVGATVIIGSGPAAETGGPAAGAEPRRLSDADVAAWWNGESAPVPPTGSGEDLALLGRVGGQRRPVMLSHRAVLGAVAAITTASGSTELRLHQGDRVVQALPMHHVAGLVTSLLPAAAVGTAVIVPDVAAGDWWESAVPQAIREHRATVVPGSPATFRALMAVPDAERQLASVRLMSSGAAPLRPEDWATVRERTGQRVWEGYGIAESASVVASTLMTPQPRPRSVGLPLPGVEIRIDAHGASPLVETVPAPAVSAAGSATMAEPDASDDPGSAAPLDSGAHPEGTDNSESAGSPDSTESTESPGSPESPEDTDSPATSGPAAAGAGVGSDFDLELEGAEGIGTVGRIAIRGQTLFSGYWPDGSDGPDADGWFVTTDIGFTDDVGELHLADRADDTVRISGFTVYPRDIEAVLIAQPGVAEAVVVGVELEGARSPATLGSTPGGASPATTSEPAATEPTAPEPTAAEPAASEPAVALAAVVGTRGSTETSAAELTRRVAELLPAFKRPRALVLVDRVPRTELGRVDRPAAAAQYRTQLLRAIAAAGAETAAATGASAAATGAAESDADAARQDDREATDGAAETVAAERVSGEPSAGAASRSTRAGQAVARAASRAAELAADLVPERLAERARARDAKAADPAGRTESPEPADRAEAATAGSVDDTAKNAEDAKHTEDAAKDTAKGRAKDAAKDAAKDRAKNRAKGKAKDRAKDRAKAEDEAKETADRDTADRAGAGGPDNVENLSRTTTPERAANLSQLGRRLPGAGTRRGRTAGDDEDDLFGEFD